jgi:hypothetical protein
LHEWRVAGADHAQIALNMGGRDCCHVMVIGDSCYPPEGGQQMPTDDDSSDDELKFRAVINTLRGRIESGRMPSNEPLTPEARA